MSHPRDDDHRSLLHQQDACSFQQLSQGEEFFDPQSGDFYEKVSDTHGRCVSGGDAFEGALAAFDASNCVQFLCGTAEASAAQALRSERPRDSGGSGLPADDGGGKQYRGERG